MSVSNFQNMADWLHCNKCAIIFKPNLKFFLTECGHIFCQSCIPGIKESKCVVCQKSNCYTEICKTMDPSVQLYFNPAEYHIKKAMEILQFQTHQRIWQYQTVAKKYAFAKRECIKLYNKNNELMQYVKIQQNLIEKAKAAIMNGVVPKFLFRSNQLATSSTPTMASGMPMCMTPAMTSDRSGMDDVSQISSIPPCTPSSNYGGPGSAAPGWKRPMTHGNGQQYTQQHQQQQRPYPPNVAPGGSGGQQYVPRRPYRPCPTQIVPGSGGRTPMGGNRPSSMGAAVSMHQLQQQGPGAKHT